MMVNLAEILKGNQWAVETSEQAPTQSLHVVAHDIAHRPPLTRCAGIRTGLDVVPGAGEGGPNAWPKAKMEIVLQKSAQFDALMAGGGAGTARVGAGARQGVPRERRPEQQQQGQGQPGSSSSGAEAAGGGRSGPTPGEASVAAPSRDAAPSSGPSP